MGRFTVKRLLVSTAMVFICFVSAAQDIEMADKFRSDGKIYVVIAVFATLMIGMFYYLYKIEKKITKTENRFYQKNNSKHSD